MDKVMISLKRELLLPTEILFQAKMAEIMPENVVSQLIDVKKLLLAQRFAKLKL